MIPCEAAPAGQECWRVQGHEPPCATVSARTTPLFHYFETVPEVLHLAPPLKEES